MEALMSTVEESVRGNLPTQVPTLELHEIQATVLRQRPAPYVGTHLLFRVDDAASGRKFLSRLAPYVDNAADWWKADDAWLALGISYAGLKAIGLPEDSL